MRSRYFLLVLSLIGFALLGVGCSDPDPLEPTVTIDHAAVSPDSPISLLELSLVKLDSRFYADLFDPEFRYLLSESQELDADPPTDFLNPGEMATSMGNILSGQAVMNWQGIMVPAVVGITDIVFEKTSDWAIADETTAFPEAQWSTFDIAFVIDRGVDYPRLQVGGAYDLFVVSRQVLQVDGTTMEWFYLVGVQEHVSAKVDESVTWGSACVSYLSNNSPTAQLAVNRIAEYGNLQFSCDASDSGDLDSGLAATPYRWRYDLLDEWTEWSDTDQIVPYYEEDGTKTVAVQVRDRWGAFNQASQEIVLNPMNLFPDTEAKLMDNFKFIYETMDFVHFLELLHPDFKLILQQDTIVEWELPQPFFNYDDEVRIHERIFSGDAVTDSEGNLQPGISSIKNILLEQRGVWEPTSSDHPYFSDAQFALFDVEFEFYRGLQLPYLLVHGQIEFYLVSEDVEVDGVIRPCFRMIGQWDLTQGSKDVDSVLWGTVMAMYR